VSGQKTWSGNQFFTSPLYPKNTSYEIGNTPASNVAIPIYFTDKNNVYTGYVRSTIYTSGRSATEIRAKNAFKNGALDTTGSDISSNLNVEVQPSGAKTIYWDGLIRNDVTPYTTNNNSLGSSTNQWSSVYAQTYYYNGTAWGLDKNNWWSLAQFYSQNSIHVRNVAPGVAPSSEVTAGFRMENADASYAFCDVLGRVNTSGTTYIFLAASNKFSNGALDPNGTSASSGLQIGIRSDGTGFLYTDCGWRNKLVPHPLESGAANLGTSVLKWKTLNGINPGALGMPDYSSVVNVDTTGWSTNAGRITYTPALTGWLQIAIPNDTDNNNEKSNFITIMDTDVPNDGFNNPSGITSGYSNDYRIQVMFPVVANKTYYIYIKSYSGLISAVKFTPCLGNV
jgi:hypothetical protein